jgi:hypothetical protein
MTNDDAETVRYGHTTRVYVKCAKAYEAKLHFIIHQHESRFANCISILASIYKY